MLNVNDQQSRTKHFSRSREERAPAEWRRLASEYYDAIIY